jgi:hypothetical protein
MDFLGNEIQVGSIILMSGVKSSGFRFAVVTQIGRGRVKLDSYHPSRKDNDNIVVITEEQLINSVNLSWNQRANADGNIVETHWTGRRDENGRGIYDTTIYTVADRAFKEYSEIIRTSRKLKGEPLGEYEVEITAGMN